MKRNSKKFLALFMAVAMSVTPTTALYAEEMNDADKLQKKILRKIPFRERKMK